MTTLLVIETGVGVPGANTWADVAEADAMANSSLYAGKWTPELAVETKEKALIEAAHLLSTCVAWTYPKLSPEQGLAIPLHGACDCAGVPVSVATQLTLAKQSQCDLARDVLEGNPLPPPSYGNPTGSGVILSESNAVGSLSTSVTYQEGTAQPVAPVSPAQLRYFTPYCLCTPLGVASRTRSRQILRTY